MKLFILGAGEYGREIADIASQTGAYEGIYLLDDGSEAEDVIDKCCNFAKFVSGSAVFYPAFGDNTTRMKWLNEVQRSNGKLTSIIHPTAYISPTAKLGECVAVLPKALVNSYCEVMDGVIVNSGAIVDHNCVVNTGAHICVGAIVKADNHIPANMKIEAGVVIERAAFYKGETK